MAEQLEIKVGADLEAASKAFEKLRKDIDKAMKGGADSFRQFVQTYQTQVPQVTKKTADATNALSNLSRVANDAPYGFIGIANNINPLIESFQRLQAESKATGSSLKDSLIAGLTGPAGVGLAVGVVSSLIVAFGDKLFSAGEKAKYLGDDLKYLGDQAEATKKQIQDLGDEINFLNKVSSLSIQIKGGTDIDVLTREIDRFKFGIQDIEENVLPDLMRKTGELAQRVTGAAVGSDEQKQAQEAAKKNTEAFNAAVQQRAEFAKNVIILEQQRLLAQKKLAEDELKEEQAKNKRLAAERERALREWQRLMTRYWQIVAQNKLDQNNPSLAPALPDVKDAEAQGRRYVEMYLNGSRRAFEKAAENSGISGSDIAAGEVAFKEFIKNGGLTATQMIEQQKQKAFELANTITGVLSPAFQGLFDSIFEGRNAVQGFFQGIAQGLKSLLSKMAAALVQALALKAIFTALFPTSGIAKASIGKLFSGLMGFADGGVVFGPTAAMIGEGRGTSRSNPEIVAPLDKLKQYIQGSAGGGVQLSVSELRLSGKDLIAAIAVNQKSQGRRY